MKEVVLKPCGPLLLLFSLSLPSVVLNPRPVQEQAFLGFQAFGHQTSCRAREQTPEYAETTQKFLTVS